MAASLITNNHHPLRSSQPTESCTSLTGVAIFLSRGPACSWKFSADTSVVLLVPCLCLVRPLVALDSVQAGVMRLQLHNTH